MAYAALAEQHAWGQRMGACVIFEKKKKGSNKTCFRSRSRVLLVVSDVITVDDEFSFLRITPRAYLSFLDPVAP